MGVEVGVGLGVLVGLGFGLGVDVGVGALPVGVQRMTNAAEGYEVDNVSDVLLEKAPPPIEEEMSSAKATVLNIFFNESCNDPKRLLSFFSATGTRSMERRVYPGTAVVASGRV